MSMRSWLVRLRAQKRQITRPRRVDLAVELLEARCVPASAYIQTNLTANVPGPAPHVDPNLTNPWGLAVNPGSGAFWVGDNVTGVSTLYDTTGQPFPPGAPLVVTVPAPPGHTGPSSPTGTVFNGTNDFVIHQGAASGPAT